MACRHRTAPRRRVRGRRGRHARDTACGRVARERRGGEHIGFARRTRGCRVAYAVGGRVSGRIGTTAVRRTGGTRRGAQRRRDRRWARACDGRTRRGWRRHGRGGRRRRARGQRRRTSAADEGAAWHRRAHRAHGRGSRTLGMRWRCEARRRAHRGAAGRRDRHGRRHGPVAGTGPGRHTSARHLHAGCATVHAWAYRTGAWHRPCDGIHRHGHALSRVWVHASARSGPCWRRGRHVPAGAAGGRFDVHLPSSIVIPA